jgi:UDP-GlcNAc:undecaprenyl-phosphate GlcNAc-1-phosphate transferase
MIQTIMYQMVVSVVIPFAVVYLSTPLFRKLAVKLRIVDLPSRRKIHKSATPLLGGLAVYLGVVGGLLFNPVAVKLSFPLLLGATAILVISLIDDIKGLSAKLRFSFEFIVALIVVIMGVRVSFLPSGWWGSLGEVIITLIWFVGVTNAFNYLDGLNGLATGSAGINFFYFALILYIAGQFQLSFLSLVLLGSCLGFLPYNFKRAKIFLGDAGSTFLGFMLAGVAVLGNWAEDNIVKICIPILILGVPIFDMIFTTIMRVKEERVKSFVEWLKYGGRDHFHHYLVDLGLLPSGAVIFIWTVTFSLGLSGVMLGNDRAWEGFLTLFQGGIIFVVIGVLIVVGKRRRSGWKREESDRQYL